jgi:prolyl oligopeptidase
MHETRRNRSRGASRRILPAVLCALSLLTQGCGSPEEDEGAPRARTDLPLSYPRTRREVVEDDYHGTQVLDPYRWLEDVDSAETRDWVGQQNALFERYLRAVPERADLARRLGELWDHERYGVPERKGERLVYRHNDGLLDQDVLYCLDGAADDTPRVLLDPNGLSRDGTIALAGTSFSRDGRWLAYGLAEAGSDWTTWQVRDVESGVDLTERLRWIKFSEAAWLDDGSGFFYSRYDEPEGSETLRGVNRDQKLWFHARGSPQSQDLLVYARSDQPEWGFAPEVSEDGRYLVVSVWHGTDPRNRVFYAELPPSEELRAGRKPALVELLPDADAAYEFAGNEGPVFWFRTDLEAPRGRVVAIDTRASERERWATLVPEGADTLESVRVVGERLLLSYLHDAHSLVRIHDLRGTLERELELPGLGTVAGFEGRREDAETYFRFTSFTTPGEIWRLDVASGEIALQRRPELDFDAARFTTEQTFATSRDGTRVPVFLTYKKGLRRNGRAPTLLYGYGGFGVPLTPSFSVSRAVWLELGGVFAQANLRGGGEYGEDWHRAGTKLAKQNVFDDFIAVAEHLIAERWTSTPRLAIQGGSNGGLLVGACMTQRPDLFGACLPAVGVLDMLRFQEFTIGWAWTSDYGSSADPEEFRALLAYSPYHNVRAGVCYPPTLVTTADHDDRVVPGHSFKFAAALQSAQHCDNPLLIRIEERAGHGSGKPTSKQIDEAADVLAFLLLELDVRLPKDFPQGAPR